MERRSGFGPRNAEVFILDTFLTFKIPLKNSQCGGEVVYGVDVQMNETREDTMHSCCITAFKLHLCECACAWWGEKEEMLNFKETVIWNCNFMLF